MTRVKSLIQKANPVPEATSGSLTGRAADELTALVGPTDDTAPARRPSRPRLLLVAAACGAAVVGAVTFLAPWNEPPGTAGPPSSSPSEGPSETRDEARGAGPAPDPAADEPHFGSTAELEGEARVIVRVRVENEREETLEERPDPLDEIRITVVRAKVLATAKGRTSGGTIEASYAATATKSEDMDGGFTPGKEYVLLLGKGEDGRHHLVNTTQGWYALADGTPYPGAENDLTLSPEVRAALRLTR